VSQDRSRKSGWSQAARLCYLVVGIALTSLLSGCGYFYAPPGAEQREALEEYLGERQTDRVSIRLSEYFGDEWTQAVIVCWSADVDELAQLVPSDLTEADLVDTDAASRILFYSESSFLSEVTFGEDLLTADRWMLTVCPTDAGTYSAPFAERIAVVTRDNDTIRLTRKGESWEMTPEDFGELRAAND
jgi:hypothetical protein